MAEQLVNKGLFEDAITVYDIAGVCIIYQKFGFHTYKSELTKYVQRSNDNGEIICLCTKFKKIFNVVKKVPRKIVYLSWRV